MSKHPPTRRSCPPSRRNASGRVRRAAAFLVVIVGVTACASLPPSSAPGTAVPSASEPSTASNPAIRATTTTATPSAAPAGLGGLLVAVEGELRVTTEEGTLVGLAGPDVPTVALSAGAGTVIAVGRDLVVRRSADAPLADRTWQVGPLATDDVGAPPRVALSPAGDRLAQAVGALQGRSFEIVVLDLSTGASRAIPVARGLDGPPVWLGPRTVAVHAIRPDQSSGFTSVDVVTGRATDIPSFGTFLSASASGGDVALDRATNGDVLVGDPADLTPDRVAELTTLPSPSGAGVDGLALDGPGTRLAVVRRTPAGVAIEIYALAGGAWLAGPTLSLATGDIPSIAWIR